MVLTYYSSSDAMPLVLDSLMDAIKPASQRPDLLPVYAFNGEGLWLTGVTVSGGGRDIGIRGRTTDPATVPGYLARLTGEPLMQGKSFASLSISQPAPVSTTGADGKPATAPAPYVEFSLQSLPEEPRK